MPKRPATETIKKINYAFTTSNRFDILQQQDASSSSQQSNIVNNVPIRARKIKIPAIVIQGQKYATIKTLLSNLKITEFLTQFSTVGVKVLLNRIDDYNTLKMTLDKVKYKFFTFAVQYRLP